MFTPVPAIIALLILVAIPISYFVIWHFIGFKVKAAHIATVTDMVTDPNYPAEQTKKEMKAHGKARVKERGMVNTLIFFALYKLINRAVKQLTKKTMNFANKLGARHPKQKGLIDTLAMIINLFLSIILGTVAACVLGHVFYKKERGIFMGALIGVGVWFKNFGTMMKSGIGTTVKVILLLVLIVVVCAVTGAVIDLAITQDATDGLIYGIVAGIALCFVIKPAFIDSYIMVRMLASYMVLVPQTEVDQAAITDMCGKSPAFKILNDRANTEVQPAPA
jgi:hypothetical protein